MLPEGTRPDTVMHVPVDIVASHRNCQIHSTTGGGHPAYGVIWMELLCLGVIHGMSVYNPDTKVSFHSCL